MLLGLISDEDCGFGEKEKKKKQEEEDEDEDEDEIGSWCLELTSSYILVTIWLASWWGGYSIT